MIVFASAALSDEFCICSLRASIPTPLKDSSPRDAPEGSYDVSRGKNRGGELVTGPITTTWSKPPSCCDALMNLSGFFGSYTARVPQPSLQLQLSPPVGRRRTVLASAPK